jgi:DNA-binding SARP family transcriptional activator
MSPSGPIRLGGPRQRSVLAILLLDANRVVSIDRLADELYGEEPPVSAVTQMHRQISELRALLEPDRVPGEAGALIETRPPGYRIVVPSDGLDLAIFERRAEAAGSALAAGDAATAVRLYREALAVWQGEPLADLAFEPFARPVVERLGELRLAVTEKCLDAELELGRGAELVPELEGLVSGHPLNERLRGQLMVALYRAGRQPEALAAFRVGRAALVEAFGIEPTPALKELESRVLLQDPALDAPSRARLAPPREEHRTVLLAATDGEHVDGLVAVGRCLAALGRHELLLTQAVESEASLAEAVAATRAQRDELAAGGVTARAAAFVSRAFGSDMARLALTHDADLTVVDRLGEIAADGSIPEELPRSSERGSPPARLRGSSSSGSGAAMEATRAGCSPRPPSRSSRSWASTSSRCSQMRDPTPSFPPPDPPAWSSWGSRRAGGGTASASRGARSLQPPPRRSSCMAERARAASRPVSS